MHRTDRWEGDKQNGLWICSTKRGESHSLVKKDKGLASEVISSSPRLTAIFIYHRHASVVVNMEVK